MSTLRIKDAPLLPNVDGSEKIPTGGRGDYAVSVDQLKTFAQGDLPQQIENHVNDTENPHQVSKSQVGLGNVDNTSDLDKPVSTAQQEALNLKADKTYVDTNLDLKADKTNVYTRSETTLALSTKADLVNGTVPSNQLPSYVDDVLEFTTSTLPIVGESGKIYITTDTNRTWRWSGNQYVEISNGGISDSTLKLETARNINGVAFDGTKDITIPKANIGLGNVDNTSDLNKPISTATQTALNTKADIDLVKRGIANRYDSTLTYNSDERVVISNGDIVKSTIDGNTNDPNVDMTGWVLVNSDSQIQTWSGRTQADKNKDFVSVKDYGAIGDGQDHPLSEFFSTLAEAKVKYPFATSLDQTIDYCAHKAAALTGKNIYTPQGDYVFKQPLLLTTVGQVWKGDGIGYGYGSPEFALRDFVPNTRIVAKGAFAKRILTRRNPRTTAVEAMDAPMSAVVEVHAMGVELRDFAVWLDCDYTDMSPTNYGADVDIGVFVACQAGFKQNIAILGYFRKVGMYFDVTRQVGLTPLLDDLGNPLPPTTDFAGGDGTVLTAPYVRGARVALAVLGAKRGTTNQYYDDVQGLVGDYRGGAGFSDFMVIGGRLYAGGHHSGVRLVDPVAPLTRALGEGADDFSPAALYIDGWASNSGSTTTGLGCLRGMVFVNVRFASSEMFRVRLGLCDEINFIGRTWIEIGTNSKPVYSTTGAVINANDYTNYTYGHMFMHSVNTGNVYADSPTGGLLTPWAVTERYTVRDSTGRMRNKAMIIEDSASSLNSNSYIKALLDIKDTGEANSNKSGLRVTSYTPSIVLSDRSGGTDNDVKLLMDSGIFRLILGNADSESWDRVFLEASSNGDVLRSVRPLNLPTYTVATLPSASGVGSGTVVYCSNGDSGNACLAMAVGGNWRRIPIGATVSAS